MGQVLRQQTNSSSFPRTVDDRATIRQQLDTCLAANGYVSGSGLSFEYCEGVVVLRGHVASFHEKQLVQEVARKVEGVKYIINRLMVDRSEFSESLRRETKFFV